MSNSRVDGDSGASVVRAQRVWREDVVIVQYGLHLILVALC